MIWIVLVAMSQLRWPASLTGQPRRGLVPHWLVDWLKHSVHVQAQASKQWMIRMYLRSLLASTLLLFVYQWVTAERSIFEGHVHAWNIIVVDKLYLMKANVRGCTVACTHSHSFFSQAVKSSSKKVLELGEPIQDPQEPHIDTKRTWNSNWGPWEAATIPVHRCNAPNKLFREKSSNEASIKWAIRQCYLSTDVTHSTVRKV